MKKFIILVAVSALIPTVSLAAYFSVGNSIYPEATAGNAYVAGNTVSVTNAIGGDLFAAGNAILILGDVSRDIFAVGNNINISGISAEDVRIAGGNIIINGELSGELMMAGGQITVAPGTTIAKDSYIAGGMLVFSGTEKGELTLAGGDITVNGIVNGNLVIKRAEKVTLGPTAVLKGNFEYSAPSEATMEAGAQINGQTTFHKIDLTAKTMKAGGIAILGGGIFLMMLLVKSLVILTAAYLLWYLRRKDMVAVLEGVRARFWQRLLHGFAFLVLVPVAAIILFSTVIGAIPACVAISVYAIMTTLAAPVSIIIATSILAIFLKKNPVKLAWYHILLGAVIFGLISLIPVIGWLACFIVYLVSLGEILNILKAKFQDRG